MTSEEASKPCKPRWHSLVCRRPLRMRDAQFSSKAYGTHEYKEVTCEGRTQFDLLLAIQRDHKLSSYSLNSVRSVLLCQRDHDREIPADHDSDVRDARTADRCIVGWVHLLNPSACSCQSSFGLSRVNGASPEQLTSNYGHLVHGCCHLYCQSAQPGVETNAHAADVLAQVLAQSKWNRRKTAVSNAKHYCLLVR